MNKQLLKKGELVSKKMVKETIECEGPPNDGDLRKIINKFLKLGWGWGTKTNF